MLVAIGLACVGPASTPEPTLTEKQLLEKVETSASIEDHEALAAFYLSQATDMEEQAAHHELMADRYARAMPKADWATHCRALASYDSRLAAEYRALAALHEGHAAELRGKQ